MKIKKEKVEHISKLARIELSEEDKANYSVQLTKILDYVEHLNKADTRNTEPTYQVSAVVNKYRSDVSEPSEKERMLIDSAPDKREGFVKVKSILK
jgi:aspartyl-tRNA(Asn)/glutamyl-tRNA(Gln) amidotransferase subunit C